MGKHGKTRDSETRALPRLVDEPDRPTGEQTRRAWPVALILGTALAAAVAVPAGAWLAGAADDPAAPSAGFTYEYATTPDPASATPTPEPDRSPVAGTGRLRPTATVTKKEIRYKSSPVPVPGPTITKRVPVPGPTKTIKVTVTPKPKIVERTVDRCFAVEFGEQTSEITCPEGN